MLSDIAQCEELFHTATGTAFADILVDGHRETWPIRRKRFRGWLRRRYYQTTGGAASAAGIRSALDLLEARAQFDGPTSTSASPSMPVTSISISLMSSGARSRSERMDGA